MGLAEVRALDMDRLLGAGILHTKMWLVDDMHFYLGSANMDWRSLTQVHTWKFDKLLYFIFMPERIKVGDEVDFSPFCIFLT